MRSLLIVLCAIGCTWGEEICCELSGDCFTDDAPFQLWPLPQCHQPTFELWRKDMEGPREISRGNTPSEYDANDTTVYLVHGYAGFESGWPAAVKDEFLQNPEMYNVIIVDWEDGASPIPYPQAASNVRVTGSEIADIDEQLAPLYSWCVGHSLGAHCCAHTAKQGAQLDRITGLDPTGSPWDGPSCSAQASECRLDRTDATQVDVIHTDGTASGSMNLLGHIDFFPNAGISPQPGCNSSTCDHNIAHTFFQVSINNDCFVSTHHNCTDVSSLPDSCLACEENECPYMGASTSHGEGVYYLETDATEPYCQVWSD